MTVSDKTPAQAGISEVSGARAWYTLVVLTLINVLSLVDRKIPFVMIDEMRREFDLSDTQVGLLGGLIFTAVYSILGFPLARLADRISRKLIVSSSLLVWSALTAAGGMSTSFAHLAAARLGLAAGEAGCVPPSQAMISDRFPPNKRGAAMSFYMAGAAVGVMGGLALGGHLVEAIGWRSTLFLVGGFGMALAVLCFLTLDEPERTKGLVQRGGGSFAEAMRIVWARRSFKYLALGGALFTAGTGPILTFTPTYLIRSLNFSTSQAGLYVGVIAGLAAGAGVLLGGWLSTRIGAKDPRRMMWLAAAGLAVGAPCLFGAFNTRSEGLLIVLLAAPMFLGSLYIGPGYAYAQSMVPAHIRATAAAVMVFVIQGIGASAGPLVVGLLSDGMAAQYGPDSLRRALMLTGVCYLGAAACLLRATRSLRADMEGVAPVIGH